MSGQTTTYYYYCYGKLSKCMFQWDEFMNSLKYLFTYLFIYFYVYNIYTRNNDGTKRSEIVVKCVCSLDLSKH
jgi:hypothetical protein